MVFYVMVSNGMVLYGLVLDIVELNGLVLDVIEMLNSKISKNVNEEELLLEMRRSCCCE